MSFTELIQDVSFIFMSAETWRDRARQRMSDLGLKQIDLIEPLGVKTRGAVGHYLNGRNDITSDQAVILADVLRCSVQWLLTGEENNVRKLDDSIRMVWIPVLNWVQAGSFAESGIYDEPIEWIPIPLRGEKHRTYGLIVQGDSMVGSGRKSYPPGVRIVVDADKDPFNGAPVIVKRKGTDEATFKIFSQEGGAFWLTPLNERYRAIEMTPDDIVVGVVIGTWNWEQSLENN